MRDRIEKKIVVRAPRARVWRAVADSKEFGTWFGMKLEGPFVAGQTVRGKMTGTEADAAVAAKQKQYEDLPVELMVERVEPEELFSFRWHPYALERGVDYSKEPTTLIEFRLADSAEGVVLTVTEPGFDNVPLERRAKALAANEEGWGIVIGLIGNSLAQAA